MQISITQALSKLKTLDARITRSVNGLSLATVVKGKEVVNRYQSNDDYVKEGKSSLQSAKDLIKLRAEIKSKIVQSNAVTKVHIGERELTVAEAIEYKTSIQYDKFLLQKMKHELANATNLYDRKKAEAANKIQALLESHFGSDSKKSNSEDPVIKAYEEANNPKLIQVVDLMKEIETLEKEIEDFEENVDYALSESNTLTRIEISE